MRLITFINGAWLAIQFLGNGDTIGTSIPRNSPMRLTVLLAAIAGLVSTSGASARQPPLPANLTICDVVWFHDQTKNAEYRALMAKVTSTPSYVAANNELRIVAEKLTGRMAQSPDLLAAYMNASNLISAGGSYGELRDLWAIASDRCLDTVRQTPEKVTQNVRAFTESRRAIAALPDADFRKALRAEIDAIVQAFGTPTDLGRTLRRALGVQGPG